MKITLSDAQKQFIENKVQSLGSVMKVEQLYDKDCAVDNYAKVYAHKIYPMKRTK